MPTASPRASDPKPARKPRRAPERVSDMVFREIAAEILRGDRLPGTAMPAEREIAERFDVSTVVVRQALYQLEELDLIEVRQGRATIVRDPEDALDLRVIVLAAELLARTPDDLRDFAEAVVLHVANLLELAERRATDVEIEDLVALAADVEVAASDRVRFFDAETRLWTAVAKATRNRLLWKQTRWWFGFLERSDGTLGRHMSPPAVRSALYREVVDHLRRRAGAARRYRELAAVLLDERLGPARPR